MTDLSINITAKGLPELQAKLKKADKLIDQLKKAIADINKTKLIFEAKTA